VSDTTLRTRRDEWIDAGVFEQVKTEALAAFDRIVGIDLDNVAVDGSLHKAPYGGEGTGPNPTDRAKLGWKCSVAAERHGIPAGWAIDGANRNDVVEATNSWWSNDGQLRRNTDQRARYRHAALCLATAISSSAASSTGATAGAQPDRLSAQVLSRPRGS
jgi:hypothetical protein